MSTSESEAALRNLYRASPKTPLVLEVPPRSYLMVDGKGDPNTVPAFRQAIEALYGLAYTTRFMLKKRGVEGVWIMPLEALWWTGDRGEFRFVDKSRFRWTAMISVPGVVTRAHVEEARRLLRERRDPALLTHVRLARLREGTSAQILHVGPYAGERPTIERLRAFIAAEGYRLAGKHHEIYLSDPRRSAPAKLRTIVRQPIRPQARRRATHR